MDTKKEIEGLRKENEYRDKIALQALIRVTALEKLLLDKKIISEDELFDMITTISSEVAETIKKSLGETNND